MSIFILPPSLDLLKSRLMRRGSNTEKEIDQRIERATYEMAKKDLYDAQVINDDLTVCYKTVKEFIQSHEKS
jgi:guanylate kinase